MFHIVQHIKDIQLDLQLHNIQSHNDNLLKLWFRENIHHNSYLRYQHIYHIWMNNLNKHLHYLRISHLGMDNLVQNLQLFLQHMVNNWLLSLNILYIVPHKIHKFLDHFRKFLLGMDKLEVHFLVDNKLYIQMLSLHILNMYIHKVGKWNRVLYNILLYNHNLVQFLGLCQLHNQYSMLGYFHKIHINQDYMVHICRNRRSSKIQSCKNMLVGRCFYLRHK